MIDYFYKYKTKINKTKLSMECIVFDEDGLVLVEKMPGIVKKKELPGDENSSNVGYLGITGSRNPTYEGLSFAKSLIDENLNRHILLVYDDAKNHYKRMVFIHGNANGIDSVFKLPPDSYCESIGILAYGAGRMTTESCDRYILPSPLSLPRIRNTSSPYEYSGGIFISQFHDLAPWTVKNAMQRSWTIANLSDVLVAIEPGDCKGGTYATARMALAANTPVHVFGRGKGVEDLRDRGAKAIGWK